MDAESLNFKGSNPGAVRHGNFINYYLFHPPENRLKVLPTDIWRRDGENPLVCLDIGCNAGDLTACLHDFFLQVLKECRMLAIDLDPTLIERAKEKHRRGDIEFDCLDFMNRSARNETLSRYLDSFNNKREFDVAFCFSITMWIHLNEGDEGLKAFLLELCKISDMIVVEPQPWKCYRAAAKRLKGDGGFPGYKQLKVRGDVEVKIAEIILAENFRLVAETERTEWGRKLFIFKRLTA